MDYFTYGGLFFLGIAILYFVEQWLIDSLVQIAKFLRWKKFILAFFTIAVGASISNFVVGVISALEGKPELSLGDVLGGNVVDMTLAVAVAAFFSKRGIPAGSKTIQSSLYFTAAAAVLPIIFILDGVLSRAEGVFLLIFFGLYFVWIFSKKRRFQESYQRSDKPVSEEFVLFLKNLGKSVVGFALVLFSAKAIVTSSLFFSDAIGIKIEIIGLLIIGLANAIPEMYFAVISARRNEEWLILGNLMGSVVIAATLVIGTVAIINPIHVGDVSLFATARFFLIMAAIFFFIFAKTDRIISKREGVFLVLIYLSFLIAEIFVNK